VNRCTHGPASRLTIRVYQLANPETIIHVDNRSRGNVDINRNNDSNQRCHVLYAYFISRSEDVFLFLFFFQFFLLAQEWRGEVRMGQPRSRSVCGRTPLRIPTCCNVMIAKMHHEPRSALHVCVCTCITYVHVYVRMRERACARCRMVNAATRITISDVDAA